MEQPQIWGIGVNTRIEGAISEASQMANEFSYIVSLSILHPTVDPKWITGSLSGWTPKIEVMAGTEKVGKGGKPLVPSRKAPLSHWLAELHEEERLHSGSRPISEFLFEQLAKLEGYPDVLSHLKEEGRITLILDWFGDSNYSAETLPADVLRKCGELGIDMEINMYCPCDEEKKGDGQGGKGDGHVF
jgi:hypothetical protein